MQLYCINARFIRAQTILFVVISADDGKLHLFESLLGGLGLRRMHVVGVDDTVDENIDNSWEPNRHSMVRTA